MSLLSRLFGGSEKPAAKDLTVTYEGFRITPDPMKEEQGFRLCATIEKEVGGEMKTHRLIRADTISSYDGCADASIAKAKQMIDQMGEGLF